MGKYNRNVGKAWAKSDDKQLRELYRDGTPVRIIALKLGRSGTAIRSRLARISHRRRKATRGAYNVKAR